MADFCIDFPCCGHEAGECREAQHELDDHRKDIIADVWDVTGEDDDAEEWDGDDYSDYYDDIHYGADDYW